MSYHQNEQITNKLSKDSTSQIEVQLTASVPNREKRK